ncbi:hypothetical protein [Bacillus atrophaeus]|uniref:hypothetical protein n=1 Tax=Bacillus atrophaeus TaxID=1452 RepID=UPI0038739D25
MPYEDGYVEEDKIILVDRKFLKSALLSNKDKVMDKMKDELIKQLNKEEPPLGVIPKWLHDERRHKELKAAINRYLDDNREISAEWIDEYNLLAKSFKTKGENNLLESKN